MDKFTEDDNTKRLDEIFKEFKSRRDKVTETNIINKSDHWEYIHDIK